VTCVGAASFVCRDTGATEPRLRWLLMDRAGDRQDIVLLLYLPWFLTLFLASFVFEHALAEGWWMMLPRTKWHWIFKQCVGIKAWPSRLSLFKFWMRHCTGTKPVFESSRRDKDSNGRISDPSITYIQDTLNFSQRVVVEATRSTPRRLCDLQRDYHRCRSVSIFQSDDLIGFSPVFESTNSQILAPDVTWRK
jgi:hypothetical protein